MSQLRILRFILLQYLFLFFQQINQVLCDGYITTRRPIVEYNMQTQVKYFQIDFNLDYNIPANNYIRLQFPLSLHQTAQTAVYASIVQTTSSPSNPTTLTKIQSTASLGTNEYTFIITSDLSMNTFYSIYVFPEVISTFGWFSQGARILAISDNQNPIVYTKNVNSGSFSINNPLTPLYNNQNNFIINKIADSDSNIRNSVSLSISTSLGLTTSQATPPFNTMGTSYWLSIIIISDSYIPGSAFFRFSINSPGNLDFILLNYCQLIQLSSSVLVSSPVTSCKVDTTENYLEASIISDVQLNDTFQILVPIQNAYYSVDNDVTLIMGNYYTKQISSYRISKQILSTQAISIDVEHLNLFFGVAYNQEEKNFPLGVFQSASATSIPVYNSIRLTFHSEQSFSLPNQRVLRAILNVSPATEVLSSSIITTLPAISGTNVYCKYQNSNIICDNVGAIVANQSYSIAFKAFFNNLVMQNQFINFCSLTIQEYNNPQSSFISTNGILVKLFVNADLRDLSPTGWHSQAFEYTSVISAPESTSLNNIYSTAYSTTTGSVGITPDQNEQALLFLLNVPEQSYCDQNLALCSNSYISQLYFRQTILFNYNVIQFSSGKQNLGLDFAAMNSAGQLDQASFRCMANNYCAKYDANSVKNTKTLVLKDPSLTDEVSLGLAFFDCGVLQSDLDPGTSPSAVSNCFNFQGKGTSVGSNGIIALRNVRFNPQFTHNTYLADDKVLDFVVTFMKGIMVNQQIPTSYNFVSTNLINAYTIVRQTLTTVKFGYANFYVDTTNKYNDGYNIPALFRLGGQFPSAQASGTTQIAVFLDESIDLTNFFWNKTSDKNVTKPYSYGCSEKECFGYQVTNGGNLDSYFLHTMVLVTLQASTDITQPFNIIIPLANNGGQKLPMRVVVGLINGQNKMQAIFRLYGPPSLGDTTVANPVTVLQGLAPQTNAYSFPLQPTGKKFSYSADASNVRSSQTGSIQFNAGTDTSITVSGNNNGLWGAGLTIVSRNQDIFSSSKMSISFQTYPGSFKQCSLASYNLVNHPAGNGQNGIYFALFCPLDDPALSPTFFSSTSANVINISTPFSYFWGSSLNLQYILQYAVSNNNGLLVASYIETNKVQAPLTNMQKCIIDQTSPIIQPNTQGKQVITVPISFNQDYSFDPLSLTNVNSFMIEINFSASVAGFVLDGSYCQVQGYLQFQNYFQCIPTWTNSQTARAKLVALQKFVFLKGQTFSLTFQVNDNLSTNFDKTSVVYSVNIMLPDSNLNPTDNFPSVFSAPDTVKVITESCSGGSLQLGNTPLGNQLGINDLRTKFINQRGRGYMKLQFQVLSQRYRINQGTNFLLNIGFLMDQNMNDNQRMDILDCQVNQMSTGSPNPSFQTSYLFSQVSFTNSNQIQITLKNDLLDPQNYTFQLYCINIRVPSSTYQANQITMQVFDKDNNQMYNSVQPILFSSIQFTSIIQNTQIQLLSWTGYSLGQFTSYKLQITNQLVGQNIDQYSAIYANFPASFNSLLSDSISCKQNGVIVQCNLDPSQPRQLFIQLSQGPILPNSQFTLEISNLATSYIDPSASGLYICLIRDYRSQINQQDFILCDFQGIIPLQLKTQVNPTGVKNISVTKVYNQQAQNTNQFYFGKQQFFSFDMNISQGAFNYIYFLLVELPPQFSKYILDSDPVSCEIKTSSRQDNLSYGCNFLNQRYIQIALVKDPQNYFGSSQYTVNLYNIYIPESFSGILADMLIFNFMIYDIQLQNIIASTTSYAALPLKFVSDTTLSLLKWINTDSFTIYQGYYKSLFTLQPLDSSVFQSQFIVNTSKSFSTLKFQNFPLQAIIADPYESFQIAGLSNSNIGFYNIDFVKSQNELIYQRVPRLSIILSNLPCILQNQFSQIQIVQGGQMTIQVDLSQCIPLNAFQLQGSILDPTQTGSFTFQDGTLVNTSNISAGQTRAFFEIKCNLNANPGQTLQLQTVVQNSQYFKANSNNIVLQVVSSSTQVSTPQPAAIVLNPQTGNSIQIQVGCDQPGYILWVAGPQSLSYDIFDSNYMFNTLITQKNYVSCINSKNSYCYDFILMNQPSMQFQVTIPNLVSRQLYYFQYYCRNQIGMFSNQRSFTFKAQDNKGRVNKISIQLNTTISNITQIQSVLCFTSQKIIANYLRVIDSNNVTCQDLTLYQKSILKTLDNNFFIYILPNQTVSLDQTTQQVQSALQIQTVYNSIFNSIGATIQSYNIQSYDDQITPSFNFSQFNNDLNSLSMSVNFTTQNGYFVVGIITISESLPQKEQFLNSVNYQNQPLMKIQKYYMQQSIPTLVKFDYTNIVQQGRLYNCLFLAIPDNPQFKTDYTSNLYNQTFTIPITQVNVNVTSQSTNSQIANALKQLVLLIGLFLI
ncbi:hypothetical protein ABPG74_014568 [Tetrahymena malaccensis]